MWTLSDETKHTNMITTCEWHKQEACLSFNYFLKLLEANNWPQKYILFCIQWALQAATEYINLSFKSEAIRSIEAKGGFPIGFQKGASFWNHNSHFLLANEKKYTLQFGTGFTFETWKLHPPFI